MYLVANQGLWALKERSVFCSYYQKDNTAPAGIINKIKLASYENTEQLNLIDTFMM